MFQWDLSNCQEEHCQVFQEDTIQSTRSIHKVNSKVKMCELCSNLTLYAPTPQIFQTQSSNFEATADELFESV